ncbi:class I SAM-dependent methyltransferase [Micromonospora sp. NPDC006766]|uniref:class I SAM-dependent methyltransferase n=1 Tax=Micromonospora sp. NPDC006766 TaxID=3154778 RepID=UPI0033F57292
MVGCGRASRQGSARSAAGTPAVHCRNRTAAEHQARYDAINSGFNELLLAVVGPGDRVLDLGCGNGQLTRLAARRSGAGHAVGVDLSAPMLDRARASAVDEGVANVEFVRGDTQVHPFPPDGFGVALSRFGVMFFADPVAAFANVGRALRPGGRLAFGCLHDVRRGDLGAVLTPLATHLPPIHADGTAVGRRRSPRWSSASATTWSSGGCSTRPGRPRSPRPNWWTPWSPPCCTASQSRTAEPSSVRVPVG